jgi:hypothetical protein
LVQKKFVAKQKLLQYACRAKKSNTITAPLVLTTFQPEIPKTRREGNVAPLNRPATEITYEMFELVPVK